MPKIKYQHFDFKPVTLGLIEQANTIIAEYAAQGFDLTLRQLYYQFVARNLLLNRDTSYKRLGSAVNDGRLAGLIDWNSINDRTRFLRGFNHSNDPADWIYNSVDTFHLDKWKGQANYVEVWIEKDALVGVLGAVCPQLDVNYFSCRGYVSQSEMWSAARRLRYWALEGRDITVLHLGDHDPSGIDMTRDITDRLNLFMLGRQVTVKRIALTMDQIEEVNAPPNPAKVTDSRYDSYRAVYGDESWELDALDPNYLTTLIREEVEELCDLDRFEAREADEEEMRDQLRNVADNWEDIIDNTDLT